MLSYFRLLVASLVGLASFAQSTVAIIPAPSQGSRVSLVSPTTLTPVANLDSLPDPARVLVNPSGTRMYLLGRSGTVSVLNPAANYTELERYSLAGQVLAARITPDGRRMVVLAGEMRIIDLSTDRPATAPAVNVGAAPDSVAISLDSQFAYSISSQSRLLTMVDLTTNRVVAQQSIPGTPRSVAVGPNGLVYVSTTSRLFEIDGRNGALNFTLPAGISHAGEGGEIAFSPDGTRAIVTSFSDSTAEGLVSVDLRNRNSTVSGVSSRLSNLTVVSESLAYALGADGRVYQFSFAPLQNPTLAAGGFPSGVLGLTGTTEISNARYVFAVTSNEVYRYDLLGQNTATISINNLGGAATFVAVPSRGPVASLRSTTSIANQTPGALSFPIVVRALDGNGLPVFDSPVTFTTGASELTFITSTARTDSQGLALVRATLPQTPGDYTVRASSATGGFVDITLRVSTQSTVTSLFQLVEGQGQVIAAGQVSQPLTVRLRDSTGAPVPNTLVTFAATTGSAGITLLSSTAITDANGIASTTVLTDFFSFTGTGPQFRTFAVDASVNAGVISGTLNFFGVVLASNVNLNAQLSTTLQLTSAGDYEVAAGGVFLGAFRVLAQTQPPPGVGLPELIPNVGLRASATSGPGIFNCREPSTTNSSGVGTCDLEVGSTVGSYTLQLVIGGLGGNFTTTYPVRVLPGQPSILRIVQGDGQSGAPGTVTARALVVEVLDVQRNPIRDAPIVWTVVSGSASLENARDRTDNVGRASTLVRFGPEAGVVTVRAASGGLSTTFTLTNTAPVGSFTIVSGNNQTAPVNSQFAAPLVVQATTPAGGPQAGSTVSFQVVSGTASVSAPTAVTGADGRAQVFVTAGSVVGPVSVVASLGGVTAPFSLTVSSAQARIDSVLNGASFVEGISRCSVGVVRGNNFVPSLSGTVPAYLGPVPVLPFSLGGVAVTVGGVAAPIYYVSNTGGVEQIGIQVPCDAPLGSQIVRVAAGDRSAERNVTVAEVQPGIFETEYTAGLRQGVVIKANGTYVSPANPAIHGETITGFFTGLGPTGQMRSTNAAGIGQPVTNTVIIGLNNQGMPILSATYAPNMIGVYQVTFRVDPALAGVGNAQAYAIAVDNGGTLVFGQPSTLPVRAQ